MKDRPWEDDLRRMEARIEARFQAISTRFTGVDERCAANEKRVDERCTMIEARVDDRCSSIERRLDELNHGHNVLVERVDLCFERVDRRFEHVDHRFDKLNRLVVMNAAIGAGSLLVSMGTIAVVI